MPDTTCDVARRDNASIHTRLRRILDLNSDLAQEIAYATDCPEAVCIARSWGVSVVVLTADDTYERTTLYHHILDCPVCRRLALDLAVLQYMATHGLHEGMGPE